MRGDRHRHRWRWRFALALPPAALALLAAPAAAGAVRVTPLDGGSPNADAIGDLYTVLLVLGAIVFVGVESALIYSLVRFRARRGRTPAQIRGNTRLEMGWTAGAALLLVVISTLTFALLPTIENPPNGGASGVQLASSGQGGERGILSASTTAPSPPNGKKITITVTGRQFVWRFTYGPGYGSPYSYEEMVAPADTVVVLRIQATDVIHSWWVPSLGGKFDAVPGYTNYTWFKAPMPHNPQGDVYKGQCAELCGRQHANMYARVRVVTPSAFTAWLAGQKARITRANADALRLRRQLEAQGQISQ